MRGLILTGLLIFIIAVSFKSFIHVKAAGGTARADDGRTLFYRHCTVCHMAAEPSTLTKEIWKLHVLPVMASRMGIIYPGYDPLRGLSAEEKAIVNAHHIIPEEPVISNEDWGKLADYVIKNAPDSIKIDETRFNRNSELTQFTRKDIALDGQEPSLITGLKYNTETSTLWVGNFYSQAITWQYDKGVTGIIKTDSPPVDFNFYQGSTYFTEIGKLYPTELNSGAYVKYNNNTATALTPLLHRPVSSVTEDLNNDGVPEVVVCSFGNKTGALSLFKQSSAGKYTEQVLLPLAGAIKCYVKDMDGDGKKDIIALFAQGDESVYIFYQKDNLKFRAKRVLRFPPNYGTTDLVLVDYNHDSRTDLITVHGDNADYSNILKPYHGIRIHIDEGGNSFKERFFYPIYGVTRVIADDFDKDGDCDLVATSFFPDFGKLVQESFIYLENKDQNAFQFKSYIQQSGVPIKTLTLEEADVDHDGDMDIITGNFAQSPGPAPQELDSKWKAAKYGLSVFINQSIKNK